MRKEQEEIRGRGHVQKAVSSHQPHVRRWGLLGGSGAQGPHLFLPL